MTTKDEALKMAIEALINSLTIQDVAINACQEALEQPKEKKYLYVYHVSGRELLFRQNNVVSEHDYAQYIGKIEVQDD